MPWTEITRAEYQRSGLRYASDMTDSEWALVKRLLPRRRRLGRPRKWDLRTIVQAILYILSTGCQWRALPKDFPPYSLKDVLERRPMAAVKDEKKPRTEAAE